LFVGEHRGGGEFLTLALAGDGLTAQREDDRERDAQDDDRREGVAAWGEKRKPEWKGR
jgi:hypothetical protein